MIPMRNGVIFYNKLFTGYRAIRGYYQGADRKGAAFYLSHWYPGVLWLENCNRYCSPVYME
jgi:hypothetical protein